MLFTLEAEDAIVLKPGVSWKHTEALTRNFVLRTGTMQQTRTCPSTAARKHAALSIGVGVTHHGRQGDLAVDREAHLSKFSGRVPIRRYAATAVVMSMNVTIHYSLVFLLYCLVVVSTYHVSTGQLDPVQLSRKNFSLAVQRDGEAWTEDSVSSLLRGANEVWLRGFQVLDLNRNRPA